VTLLLKILGDSAGNIQSVKTVWQMTVSCQLDNVLIFVLRMLHVMMLNIGIIILKMRVKIMRKLSKTNFFVQKGLAKNVSLKKWSEVITVAGSAIIVHMTFGTGGETSHGEIA
jgi:hypothetical protein